MMDVMEKLTDKEDWHIKVFNDEIVAKWREEALAIPDQQFMQLAISAKRQYWDRSTGSLNLEDDDDDTYKVLEGIMTENTFDCVSVLCF